MFRELKSIISLKPPEFLGTTKTLEMMSAFDLSIGEITPEFNKDSISLEMIGLLILDGLVIIGSREKFEEQS